MELESAGQLPVMHDIQQSLQSTMNDNLPIIVGENYQRITSHEQLINHNIPTSVAHVKKRKNASQSFMHDGENENLKSFVKSETSESFEYLT
jgi:hypothetical protein